jgi:hypothetical protein
MTEKPEQPKGVSTASGSTADIINNFYSEVGTEGGFGRSVNIYPAVGNVAAADPSNIQEVAASQLALSAKYYESVLLQARQSFRVALGSAVFGLLFFLAAVAIALFKGSLSAATISAVGGGIVEVISGLNFWLYGRTSGQLDIFHVRLEQTQRYLLANSISTRLTGQERSDAVAGLVQIVAIQQVPSRDKQLSDISASPSSPPSPK